MNFAIRELEEEDLGNGFLETLDHLRNVGIEVARANEILRKIKSNAGNKIFVAVNDDGNVIGSTTLLIEQKFIHKGGLVGHIEDVVTHKNFRNMGIGKALVERAAEAAKSAGCYKVILNCSEENIPFYEKIGFKKHGIEMRFDLK